MKDFVIDKISWHTKLDPSPAFQLRARKRFSVLYEFLLSRDLLAMPLDAKGIESEGDFELRASHLTPLGFKLMKIAYSKWLKATDRNQDLSSTTVLEKELERLKTKSPIDT